MAEKLQNNGNETTVNSVITAIFFVLVLLKILLFTMLFTLADNQLPGGHQLCEIFLTPPEFIKRDDLPKVTIHSLWHTNIMLLIMAVVPLRTVAKIAGHSSTVVFYQYISPKGGPTVDFLKEMITH